MALIAAFAIVCGGTAVALRLNRSVPAPTVTIAPPLALVAAAGPAPAVTLPPTGSLALRADGARLVGSDAARRLAGQDSAQPHPIASIAKVMTALAVLDAKPLIPGDDGPAYTITAADVAIRDQARRDGGSYVNVTAGERFTERQLLLALLLPSGNNLAETLGAWVAGTRPAFVDRLNARAAALGMSATHFVDASGFDDGTVASADDLVVLGRAALADAALADIVATPSTTLPDGQTVGNLDSFVVDHVPGWLGIKTGNTNAGGGCLLFAVRRAPAGDDDPLDAVTLVGATLGQRARPGVAGSDLGAAFAAARDATASAFAGYRAVRPESISLQAGGSVTTEWGTAVGLHAGAAAATGPFVVRQGDALPLRAAGAAPSPPLVAGAEVGDIEARSGDRVVARWPVVTDATVPDAPWSFRLFSAR